MTVQELINALQQVENKDLPVYTWGSETDITSILFVDELDDRVDLNMEEGDE